MILDYVQGDGNRVIRDDSGNLTVEKSDLGNCDG
jgi:hypothetical protein